MLPHFIGDRNMGLACPPQTFYDMPDNDPLTQTMDYFGGIQELFGDALDHANCLGSGYVMRRSAIESIGGIPTESLTEDVCTSTALIGAGWKTAFVPETVQCGSIPESLFAHVKQRTRWFVGNIQIAMLFKLRFCSIRSKHCTWRQRIAGLAFDLSQIVQIPNVLAWFSIPYCLLRGYPFVVYTDQEDLKGLIK
jgi:cellulose synthase/poly-beta-1,6-N-acetylglucosamine synthase-like glycosyltransferase